MINNLRNIPTYVKNFPKIIFEKKIYLCFKLIYSTSFPYNILSNRVIIAFIIFCFFVLVIIIILYILSSNI